MDQEVHARIADMAYTTQIADSLGGGRKDCVLHARIPPALDQALRQRARREKVSVSRLIRDLLVDAMSHEEPMPLRGDQQTQSPEF